MKKKYQLQTVSNYAKSNECSQSYVYRLIKDGKIKSESIDGVLFVKIKPNKTK